MSTRKPFNQLTKRTVLVSLNGQPVQCSFPGCTNEVHNLKAMCKKHHIQLHSTRGDFRAWGSLGGKATHAEINVNALKNLPQFRGAAGEARLAAYIARKSAEMSA
jgi:hypothetical protein